MRTITLTGRTASEFSSWAFRKWVNYCILKYTLISFCRTRITKPTKTFHEALRFLEICEMINTTHTRMHSYAHTPPWAHTHTPPYRCPLHVRAHTRTCPQHTCTLACMHVRTHTHTPTFASHFVSRFCQKLKDLDTLSLLILFFPLYTFKANERSCSWPEKKPPIRHKAIRFQTWLCSKVQPCKEHWGQEGVASPRDSWAGGRGGKGPM